MPGASIGTINMLIQSRSLSMPARSESQGISRSTFFPAGASDRQVFLPLFLGAEVKQRPRLLSDGLCT
jgi:hypothetical protein